MRFNSEHPDPIFEAALRDALSERKWTAAELSRRTRRRVSESSISEWLRGQSLPSGASLQIVCETLGLRRSEFWRAGEEIVERYRARQQEAERERRRAELLSQRDTQAIMQVLRDLSPSDRAALAALLETDEEASHG